MEEKVMKRVFGILVCLLMTLGISGCGSEDKNEMIGEYFKENGYTTSQRNPFEGEDQTWIEIEKDNVGFSSGFENGEMSFLQYHDHNKSVVSCNIYNPDNEWVADTEEKKEGLAACESSLDSFVEESGFSEDELKEYFNYLYEKNSK